MDAWERMVAREASDLLPHLIESFEQGEFEIMASDIEQLADVVTTCEDAAWMQNRLLAHIALQLATHNHWLEQIAHTLKSLDDNSIVTQKP